MAVILLLLSLASIGMTTRREVSRSGESLDVLEHYVNSSGTAAKTKCCCTELKSAQVCRNSEVKVELVKPSEISPQSSDGFVCCERVELSNKYSNPSRLIGHPCKLQSRALGGRFSISLERLAREWQASGMKPMRKRDVNSKKGIAERKSWIQPSPPELEKLEDEGARTKEEADKQSRFLYDDVEILHGRATEWFPHVSVSELDCSSPVTYSMIWVDVPNFREPYGRHYSYKIPADIAVLATAIRSKRGFPHEDGIIREPGDKVQVNLLQGKIAAGTITMTDLADADTHTLASALKERLREMPSRLLDFMPAITEPWRDVIEEAGKWESALLELSQASASDLIDRMPEPIRTVTMYVLDFLLEIADGRNDESTMSVAIAVAPSLLSDSARMERAYETKEENLLKLAPDCLKRKGILVTRLLKAWRKHNVLTRGISKLIKIEKQVQLLGLKYSRFSENFNRANQMALDIEKSHLRPKCEEFMQVFRSLAEQLKLNVRHLPIGGNDLSLQVKESRDLQTAVVENMLSLQKSLGAYTNLPTKALAKVQSDLAASREKLEQLLNAR